MNLTDKQYKLLDHVIKKHTRKADGCLCSTVREIAESCPFTISRSTVHKFLKTLLLTKAVKDGNGKRKLMINPMLLQWPDEKYRVIMCCMYVLGDFKKIKLIPEEKAKEIASSMYSAFKEASRNE